MAVGYRARLAACQATGSPLSRPRPRQVATAPTSTGPIAKRTRLDPGDPVDAVHECEQVDEPQPPRSRGHTVEEWRQHPRMTGPAFAKAAIPIPTPSAWTASRPAGSSGRRSRKSPREPPLRRSLARTLTVARRTRPPRRGRRRDSFQGVDANVAASTKARVLYRRSLVLWRDGRARTTSRFRAPQSGPSTLLRDASPKICAYKIGGGTRRLAWLERQH